MGRKKGRKGRGARELGRLFGWDGKGDLWL